MRSTFKKIGREADRIAEQIENGVDGAVDKVAGVKDRFATKSQRTSSKAILDFATTRLNDLKPSDKLREILAKLASINQEKDTLMQQSSTLISSQANTIYTAINDAVTEINPLVTAIKQDAQAIETNLQTINQLRGEISDAPKKSSDPSSACDTMLAQVKETNTKFNLACNQFEAKYNELIAKIQSIETLLRLLRAEISTRRAAPPSILPTYQAQQQSSAAAASSSSSSSGSPGLSELPRSPSATFATSAAPAASASPATPATAPVTASLDSSSKDTAPTTVTPPPPSASTSKSIGSSATIPEVPQEIKDYDSEYEIVSPGKPPM